EACDHIGVRVAEDVADVEGAGCRRRGSVDGEHLAARAVPAGRACRDPLSLPKGHSSIPVEPVRPLTLPGSVPLGFEPFEGGLFGDGVGHGLLRFCMCGTVSHAEVPECEIASMISNVF